MKFLNGLAAGALLLAASALPALAADVGRPRLIHDSEIAKPSPGPYGGGGQSVGHPFSVAAGVKGYYFSKRILHPGASVGRHVMDTEEVYYLVSGEAEFIDDVGPRTIKAGTGIFMLPGQTAELHQRGKEDAILIVISPPQ